MYGIVDIGSNTMRLVIYKVRAYPRARDWFAMPQSS